MTSALLHLTKGRRARTGRGVAVVLAASTAACFPVLPVSPRVAPGLQSGFALTAHVADARAIRRDDSTRTQRGVRPQATVTHEFGWVPESETRPAVRLGLALATGWRGVGGTVFVQAPRRWTGGWDAGVGALAEVGTGDDRGLVASVGRQLAGGALIAVSGAVLDLQARREGSRQRLGSLQVSVETPTRAGNVARLIAGGVFGPWDLRCGETAPGPTDASSWCPWGTRVFVGAGVQVRWRGRRRVAETRGSEAAPGRPFRGASRAHAPASE